MDNIKIGNTVKSKTGKVGFIDNILDEAAEDLFVLIKVTEPVNSQGVTFGHWSVLSKNWSVEV